MNLIGIIANIVLGSNAPVWAAGALYCLGVGLSLKTRDFRDSGGVKREIFLGNPD
jgi:hypothetical protein